MKNSACVAKTKKLKGKTISKKSNKDNIHWNKKKSNRRNKSENTYRGILELFDADKESILLYHLSMLEAKRINRMIRNQKTLSSLNFIRSIRSFIL